MQADRDHVHHRLLLKGLPVRQAVLLLYAACLIFSGLSLAMVLGGLWLARLGLLISVGFALLLGYWFGYLRSGPHGLWAALTRRQRTRQLLDRLNALSTELASAQQLADLKTAIEQFGSLLGVPLRLDLSTDPKEAATDGYPIVVPGKQGRLLGYLRPVDAEHQANPDERTLLGLLCDAVAPHLARVLSTEKS
jgi:hypothetical protein